ncbi:MAG TPA: 2-dehydro-3-deoxy-6-phosphogalactonate aldolase [Sphingomicrobium sp.]
MTAKELFHHYFDRCPLVAIIRGVMPDEAEAIGQAVYDAGIRIIEVPLNSPDPIDSIRRLAAKFGESMLVGGGTVLEPERVEEIKAAGGRLIVAPNTNVEVIEETVAAGLVSCPGYFTPSDAFDALEAGATALKLFPAEGASPAVLKAQRAVIPKAVPILVVGGVKPETMRPWLDAGADGFGLGGGLYQPGQSPAETGNKARAYVAALKA